MTDHIPREQLLRYVDGELSQSAMTETARHLESCWACRAELERLQAHITDIIDAQQLVFAPRLPSPPKPWPRLEPKLYAAEKRLNHGAFWKRLVPLTAVLPRPSVGLATVTLIAILIAALVWWPVTPISAKEVLQQVKMADAKRFAISPQQVIRQQVSVKKTTRQNQGQRTSTVDSWKSAKSAYWSSKDDSISADLANRYKAEGLGAELPLSAAAIEAWTIQAGSEPTASRKADGSIDVRVASSSEAHSGGLEELNLHVQPRDWHVDAMTLSFGDAVFDIAEEGFSVVDRRDVPQEVLAALEPPAALPHAPEARASLSPPSLPRPLALTPNLDDVELGVRYDLHSIGADLGESIEVSQNDARQIVVNAWRASPERKLQLLGLLEKKPDVLLEFRPPDESVVPSEDTSSRILIIPQQPSAARPHDDPLEKFFGSADSEENYTRTVLQISTDMLSHYYALRTLADRWPAERASHLSREAKAELSSMVQDHAQQVRADLKELKAELAPLLDHFGYTTLSDVAAAMDLSWQQSSVSGLESAKHLDNILRSLLTTSDSPMSIDVALPGICDGLAALDRAFR